MKIRSTLLRFSVLCSGTQRCFNETYTKKRLSNIVLHEYTLRNSLHVPECKMNWNAEILFLLVLGGLHIPCSFTATTSFSSSYFFSFVMKILLTYWSIVLFICWGGIKWCYVLWAGFTFWSACHVMDEDEPNKWIESEVRKFIVFIVTVVGRVVYIADILTLIRRRWKSYASLVSNRDYLSISYSREARSTKNLIKHNCFLVLLFFLRERAGGRGLWRPRSILNYLMRSVIKGKRATSWRKTR